MFNFVGIQKSKIIQKEDVKVFANNAVKLGDNAIKKLGLNRVEHRLFIDKDISGKMYVAAMPIVKNEEGKVVSAGRQLNDNHRFTHARIANELGDNHSVWMIEGEGQEFEGVTYYEIVQTVKGEEVVAKQLEEARAAGIIPTEVEQESDSPVMENAEDRAALLNSELNEEEATEDSEGQDPVGLASAM